MQPKRSGAAVTPTLLLLYFCTSLPTHPPAPRATQLYFWRVMHHLCKFQSAPSLGALLATPRPMITGASCLRTSTVLWTAGSDVSVRLQQRIERLREKTEKIRDAEAKSTGRPSPVPGASPPSAEPHPQPAFKGGKDGGEVALEGALALFSTAWEEGEMTRDQKLRAAFTAAQPPGGVLTFQAFRDLVHTVGGGSLLDSTIVGMFETALDASNALLEQTSDLMLVQGFVYACKMQGLVDP